MRTSMNMVTASRANAMRKPMPISKPMSICICRCKSKETV